MPESITPTTTCCPAGSPSVLSTPSAVTASMRCTPDGSESPAATGTRGRSGPVRVNGAGEGLASAASGIGEGDSEVVESGAAVLSPLGLGWPSEGAGEEPVGCWGAGGNAGGGGPVMNVPALPPVAEQMRVGRPRACRGALPAEARSSSSSRDVKRCVAVQAQVVLACLVSNCSC
jgi:hypothetical protein